MNFGSSSLGSYHWVSSSSAYLSTADPTVQNLADTVEDHVNSFMDISLGFLGLSMLLALSVYIFKN